MFEDLSFGPMILYSNSNIIQSEVHKLLQSDWYPIGLVLKGEMFESIKKTLPENLHPPLLGIIISIGFHKKFEV